MNRKRQVLAVLSSAFMVGGMFPLASSTFSQAEMDVSAVHGTANEQHNLERAIYCMELLEVYHDIDLAETDCFAEIYIQHTPRFPDGKEAVLEALRNRHARNPHKTVRIVRTAVEGDFVWLHMHSQRFSGDERGNAVVNIFRMKDGRFAEHWNVVQPVPETSRNENSMF